MSVRYRVSDTLLRIKEHFRHKSDDNYLKVSEALDRMTISHRTHLTNLGNSENAMSSISTICESFHHNTRLFPAIYPLYSSITRIISDYTHSDTSVLVISDTINQVRDLMNHVDDDSLTDIVIRLNKVQDIYTDTIHSMNDAGEVLWTITEIVRQYINNKKIDISTAKSLIQLSAPDIWNDLFPPPPLRRVYTKKTLGRKELYKYKLKDWQRKAFENASRK